MKAKIIFLFLFSFIIILGGCAGLKKNRYGPPPDENKKSMVSSESQEMPTTGSKNSTMDLPTSNPSEGTTTTAPVEKKSTTSEKKVPVTPEPTYETEKVMGWRVQIIACKEKNAEESARLSAEEAGKALFEPTYLVQDGIWWKVRIGNCRTREEAEKLKERAIKAGYKDAWIVQSEVIVRK